MTAFDQPLDHRDDFVDVVRCARLHRGQQIAERPNVLVVRHREAFGEIGDRFAGFERRFVDLVVDVGDVAGVPHLRIHGRQQPVQHVEHHRRPAIADVHQVVDGRTADVHRHAVGVERLERLFAPGEGVVQRDVHAESFPVSARRGRFVEPNGISNNNSVATGWE